MQSVMLLNKEYSDDTQIDGFSTFGLKIRHLEAVSWFEVSVRGKLYHPRTNYSVPPTKQAYTQLGNQLVDGTIVDIGGVSFVFQTPNRMVQDPKVGMLILSIAIAAGSITSCYLTDQPHKGGGASEFSEAALSRAVLRVMLHLLGLPAADTASMGQRCSRRIVGTLSSRRACASHGLLRIEGGK
jgi:hypothetical protein